MRVATYNIHRGVGTDGVEDLDRIVAVLRELNVDLIALQEVGYRSRASLDVARHLAHSLGARLLPGITLTDERGHYGNAVLTRLPIQTVQRFDISVEGREARGVLVVSLTRHARTLRVMATHLGLSAAERRRQIDTILAALREQPLEVDLLLGDFNEWVPRSRLLRRIGGVFGKHPVARPTFPSRWPIFALDRIWCRPGDAITSLSVHRSPLARLASDHLPLVAELDFSALGEALNPDP